MDGACFLNPWRHKDITRLWNESFGDTTEYINLFVDRHIDSARCAAYIIDGTPQSMLFLLDVPLRLNSVIYKASYVYAACTAKSCRGGGLMSQLLNFACSESKADFVCLVPSEASLFDYYSRCGFVNAFSKKTVAVGADELLGVVTVANGNHSSVSDCRSACMGDGILWDDSAINYALDENAFCGGKSLLVREGASSFGYALAAFDGSSAFIKESVADERTVSRIVGFLRDSGCDEFRFDLPYDGKGERIMTGMARAVSPLAKQVKFNCDAYLGLSLG